GATGLRPHVPDAVLRSDPERDRHGHHGGGEHLRPRSREFDPDGRTRRPVLPGAAASGGSVLDAARGRAARVPRRELAGTVSRRPRPTPPARIAVRCAIRERVMTMRDPQSHFNCRVDGAVAVVSLARPERKNPLTFESYAALRDWFRGLTADHEVKAVVIG